MNLATLPADAVASVIRLCSARTLVRIAHVCHGLSALARQQAELLLSELCAAGKTLRTIAAGAATIQILAHLCGRRVLVTRRFYQAMMRTFDCIFLGNRPPSSGADIPRLPRTEYSI
mmetsp:Transcript_52416/g.117765  ORF Transcript_52416/g.117765 Transcript_52416/m.117765 type:complete len:117 (-) Transcript_52416:1265-1615(-)